MSTAEKDLEMRIEAKVREVLEKRLDTLISEKLQAMEKKKKNRIAIIASKGTLDMAYPPLILATTAVAMDMEAGIFFTFYGLDIIHKKKFEHLKVPSLANPAMPVPIPNIIGMLPGMTAMATLMMKSWMAGVNVATIPQLLEIAKDSGVTMIGCQMTMDVMGVKRENLLDGIEVGGAATFLEYASHAGITVFV
jgi:peroxiredoxin family protein